MDKKKNRYKEQLINALKRRTKKQHSLKTVATALVITLMVVVFVDQIRVRAQEEQGIAHQNTQIAQDAQQTTQKIYIKEVSTSPQFQYDENSIEIIEGYLKCKKDDHILQWQKGRYQWECRKATKVVFNDLGGSVDVSSSGTIKCKNNNEMLYWNTKKDHWSCGNAGSTITISDIDGVNISQNPTSGDIMYFDGEDWVNESIPSIIDGSFFAQNGNAFGQNALLGTNDDYALVFETNDTERMWITEDGNVGIGTDTPDRLFVVSQEQNAGTVGRIENIGTGIHSNARWEINSDASSFQLLSHGSGRTITRYGLALDGWSEILFKDSPTTGGSNGLIIGSEQDLPIVFANNNLERMRIDAGGNVGIGTDAPSNTLTVDGTFNTTGHSAFGNAAVVDGNTLPFFGGAPLSTTISVAESITATTPGVYAGITNVLELNPSADVLGNMYMSDFNVMTIASSNVQDFGFVVGNATMNIHEGSGMIDSMIGSLVATGNDSTGSIEDLVSVSGSLVNSNVAGSVTNAYGLDSYISNSGAMTNVYGVDIEARTYDSGIMTNVRGINIHTPQTRDTSSMTNIYGLYINDQSGVATNDGFNIYSLGANSVNYFEGNVGIGTLTPTQKLHINGNMRLTGALYDSTNSAGTSGYVLQTTGTGTQWVNTSTLGMVFENASGVVRNTGTNASDDFVFGSPQLAYDGNSDHNARIFFDKSRGAFRAGVTTSTQWDDSNVGNYSIALGDNAIASGLNSVSIGRGTTANNRYATAFGHSTTASGNWTTTFGRNTTASGDYSMAFGSGTTARSGHEVVFGQYEEVYTPNSTTGWDANDSLFVVANGAIPSARSNALTILKNGDIGIGTATPSQRLTVYNGSTTGTYTTSGWVHSSDRNLKTNIEPIENSLEKVLSLENVYFNWKTNPNDNRQIGFIAQDVKEIIPEIVVGNEQDGYGLSYGNMSALLTGAIKEQNINITSNTLQTDTNINTLQQLQTSVDENLATIQGQFVNANDRYINLSLQVDDIENNILALQSEANQQAKLLDELQLTLEQAQEGIDILTHIDTRILTIDPDALLFINDEVLQKAVVDEDGNEAMQDITELTLNGIMTVTTLKTQHIQTNTFAISDDIIDENDGKDVNASSIGTAIIPAGETEIKVNTQAVAEGSRVFVTPKKALNQALAAEDIVWDESFVVKLLELHDADIAFDWFIVGSK